MSFIVQVKYFPYKLHLRSFVIKSNEQHVLIKFQYQRDIEVKENTFKNKLDYL